MSAAVFKQQAHRLIDGLPESASWEDLAEQVGAILDIEAGLAEATAGRITEHAEIRREFDLG